MAWIGRKKIAFIPLHRPNAHPPDDPIPADWPAEILRRVYYDPNAFPGLPDRSLRTYIHRVSSGLADLDATVLPMQVLDQQDVPPDALESQLGPSLRAQGFAAAALVMLGQPPTGQGQRGGFWARFDMSETLGTWAMELMHCLTGMDDLYPFGGNMAEYDNMAGAGGTHPSAWTKRAVQWLDPAAIAQHVGRTIEYDLHAVESGAAAAARSRVRRPDRHDVPYLMVEARKMADQFDGIIPKEGVIVYRVQTTDPLGHTQNQLAAARTPHAGRRGQPQRARRRRIAHDGHRRRRAGDQRDSRRLSRAHRGSLAASRRPLRAVPDACRGRAAPTSVVIPGLGVHNIDYRDTVRPPARAVARRRSDAPARRISPRTRTRARRTEAVGNPFAYVDPTTNSEILLYRGGDNNVHSLLLVDRPGRPRQPHGIGRRAEDGRRSGRLLQPPTTTTTSSTARGTATSRSCGGPATSPVGPRRSHRADASAARRRRAVACTSTPRAA